ncbi:hypothetical protein VTN00DRAFT_1759 [Thermoascus crustaceus]|uniref:uncharacterized protein n=1 Tax=Thermoascus crustaceus TaxID=5088 RepID=UPI0037429BA6
MSTSSHPSLLSLTSDGYLPIFLSVGLFLPLTLVLLFYLWTTPSVLKDSRRRHLPPGPPGLPFVGNLFDLADSEAVPGKITKWARKYGDVFYTKIDGTDYVWLPSPKAVKGLMDKRSLDLLLPSTVASGSRRRQRRTTATVHAVWTPVSSRPENLTRVAEHDRRYGLPAYPGSLKSKQLMAEILDDPGRFYDYNRRYSSSAIIRITYGFRLQSWDHPLIKKIYSVLNDVTEFTAPGAHVVDSFPSLQYLPEWIPGNWRTYGKKIKAGTAKPCFCKDFYESDPAKQGIDDLQAAFQAGELIEAESPYIRAIVKENLRLNPLNKFGMTHASTEDDWYEGIFTPKGSVVVLNWWAVHFNEDLYPDPYTFNPERYLNHPLPAAAYINTANPYDRDHLAYGAGRRVCPGVHVAERSLYLNIARILWGFNISRKKDANGEYVEPEMGTVRGFLNVPLPFECDITVRSEKHAEVIRGCFREAMVVVGEV